MAGLVDQPMTLVKRQLRPMLAQPVTRLPTGEPWAYEFKWDGVRALAYVDRGGCSFISRNGSDLTQRFPELASLGEQYADRAMVLDGEIVSVHEGKADFGRLQKRIHMADAQRIAHIAVREPVTYMAFDVLALDGRDVTAQPLSQRRALLESLNISGAHWATPPISRGGAEAFVQVAREHGMEGVIAKRWDSLYQPGTRSDAWVKFKLVLEQEFVVGGWRPSQAGSTQLGALAVGFYDTPGDEKPTFAGFVGSGFNQLDHRELLSRMHALAQPTDPFRTPPPRHDVRFVRPELVVQVRFAQWTAQGILRHASYRGMRSDKSARDVVRET